MTSGNVALPASELAGRGAAWTEEQSELAGRGAVWTEERGTSDEGRRHLKAPWRASGEQSTSDEGRRRLQAPRGRAGKTERAGDTP
jgi:hypothetical protein